VALVDSSKRSADGDGRAGDSHRFIVNVRGDAEIEHLKQLIFEKTGLSSKRKFGLHAYDAARFELSRVEAQAESGGQAQLNTVSLCIR
jgi:hypothetical protein